MSSSSIIYALRWLVRDTFRQAMAGMVFWIMLALTGLCVLFCLSLSIENGESLKPDGTYLTSRDGDLLTGPNPDPGTLNLLFGAFSVPLHRDGEAEVHLIQVVLGTWVAGTFGLVFTLVWTAGFLPDFLQTTSASVLLAKPLPRWVYLTGKFCGVVCFVAFQGGVFFLTTWIALGLRTNIWMANYLVGFPILVFQFAVLYSFSVALAVATRSTVACVLGIVLFWGMCMGLNYGRHAAAALPTLSPAGQHLTGLSTGLIDLGYWALPKPADTLMILEDSLNADKQMATLSSLPEFATVRSEGHFDPVLILFTSLLFCVGMLTLSGQQLGKVDY